MQPILAFLALCLSVALSDPNNVIVPCRRSDEVCMIKSANIALPIIAAGIPALGVDGFDPARVQEISGQNTNFFYNFTDNAVSGYSKCTINAVKLNLDASKLKFDILCNTLEATGHLVISGELLGVPVEGNNHYKMISGKYLIRVDADIEEFKGADGRQHLAVTTFKHSGVPYEPFQFIYDNFKAKTELSPEAEAEFNKNKFLKAVSYISDNYIDTLYKNVMFKNLNKLFETVPLEDLFID